METIFPGTEVIYRERVFSWCFFSLRTDISNNILCGDGTGWQAIVKHGGENRKIKSKKTCGLQ